MLQQQKMGERKKPKLCKAARFLSRPQKSLLWRTLSLSHSLSLSTYRARSRTSPPPLLPISTTLSLPLAVVRSQRREPAGPRKVPQRQAPPHPQPRRRELGLLGRDLGADGERVVVGEVGGEGVEVRRGGLAAGVVCFFFFEGKRV